MKIFVPITPRYDSKIDSRLWPGQELRWVELEGGSRTGEVVPCPNQLDEIAGLVRDLNELEGGGWNVSYIVHCLDEDSYICTKLGTWELSGE